MLGGQKQQIPKTVIQSRRGVPQERRRQGWDVDSGGEGHSQAWPFTLHLPWASLEGLGAGGSGLGTRERAT